MEATLHLDDTLERAQERREQPVDRVANGGWNRHGRNLDAIGRSVAEIPRRPLVFRSAVGLTSLSASEDSPMARRKIVVATMMHETNTFSPVPTPLASFRPLTGDAAIQEFKDTNTLVSNQSRSRTQ